MQNIWLILPAQYKQYFLSNLSVLLSVDESFSLVLAWGRMLMSYKGKACKLAERLGYAPHDQSLYAYAAFCSCWNKETPSISWTIKSDHELSMLRFLQAHTIGSRSNYRRQSKPSILSCQDQPRRRTLNPMAQMTAALSHWTGRFFLSAHSEQTSFPSAAIRTCPLLRDPWQLLARHSSQRSWPVSRTRRSVGASSSSVEFAVAVRIDVGCIFYL